MRFQDIQRQKTWLKQVNILVEEVGEPMESANGFCQAIVAKDATGITETLNYFYASEHHPDASIRLSEVGSKYYDIRWKDNYFQCKPCDPPPVLEKEGPDWDKIALGKCRFGILCAMIQGQYLQFNETMKDQPVNPYLLKVVNRLANFSMTGEIE